MTRPITICDATGAILRTTMAVKAGEEQCRCRKGESWVRGDWDAARWRIDLANGKPAPLLEYDLTITPNRLSGIPEGAQLLCQGRDVPVEGGVATFAANLPQDAEVMLHHPLYGSIEITVPCGLGGEGFALDQDYRRLRESEQRPVKDQLDDIMRGLEAVSQGRQLPQETLDAIAAWRGVKTRFPKPAGT